MKRKLVCLFLSILMLMTTLLTGCSQNTTEEEEDEVDNSAKTITMWVMAPDYETDEEKEAAEKAQAKVQEAFTNITKSKYKTNVELKFVSESEYYKKLEETILAERADALLKEQAEDALAQFLKGKDAKDKDKLMAEFYEAYPEYKEFADSLEEDETGVVEEETQRNEWGVSEIKYPAAKKNQVDIFYLSGYEKYTSYHKNEWLAGLDEELALSSKKLTDYIAPTLLSGVQLSGGVYAIPNNVPIGEYTYALIDKTYFDMYYNKIDSVENVLDLDRFLNDMKNMNEENGKTAEDEGYVVPLASTFEECMEMLVWYWEMSYTDRTVYETWYDEDSGYNYVLGCTYQVEVEKTNELTQEVEVVMETRVIPFVKQDQVYKVNEKGQYVNAEGEVLNYRYETIDDVRYQIDGLKARENGIQEKDIKAVAIEGTDEEKAELLAQAGGMYLVDENGLPVTPENDERVILVRGEEDKDGNLVLDENGKPLIPEIYDAEGNVVALGGKYIEVVLDDIAPASNVDGWPRQTFYYDFNKDADFSALGTIYKNAADRSRGEMEMSFSSLLADQEYRDLYATLKNYEYQEYFGMPTEGQQAAVSFMKGDAHIKYEYEENGVYVKDGREYYVFVAEYPEATETELYGNMYAVYANSNNLSRSMEVITCLNTNKELRNLLQYGVEGWHYERDEETGLVKTLKSKEYGSYRMDQQKTGNCFIVYPTVEQGVDAWKYAKIQNNDSLINPLLGFDFNEAASGGEYNMDVALMDYMKEISNAALEQMDECGDKESLSAVMAELGDLYGNTDAMIRKATDYTYDPTAKNDGEVDVNGSSSPYAVYVGWLNAYGYNVVVTGDKK